MNYFSESKHQSLQVGRVLGVDGASRNHLDVHIVIDAVLAALAPHARVLDTSESVESQYRYVPGGIGGLTAQQNQKSLQY